MLIISILCLLSHSIIGLWSIHALSNYAAISIDRNNRKECNWQMEQPESASPTISKQPRKPTAKQVAVALGMMRDGKSFKQSALDAGYSPTVAKQGLKQMAAHNVGIDTAIKDLTKQLLFTPDEMRVMALNKLCTDIHRGRSSGLERTIELLGRFKMNDWFVRSADVNVGVMAVIGAIDKSVEGPVIDQYREP